MKSTHYFARKLKHPTPRFCKTEDKSIGFVSHQACEADALASAEQIPTQGDASASLKLGFVYIGFHPHIILHGS
jgi:hypothetical protein